MYMVSNSDIFSSTTQLKIVAKTLVSNEQGGPLAALQVSAGQHEFHRTLSGLVVHAAVCLFSLRNVDILCPLTTLLTKPGDMAVSELAAVCQFKFSIIFCLCRMPTSPQWKRTYYQRPGGSLQEGDFMVQPLNENP